VLHQSFGVYSAERNPKTTSVELQRRQFTVRTPRGAVNEARGA
jgi:hypothetical protein